MKLAECIIKRAKENTDAIPRLAQLLEEIHSDPTLLEKRIEELHAAHLAMVDWMGKESELDTHPFVKKLKDLLITSGSDLTHNSPGNVDSMDSRDRLTSARATFAYIADHKNDEWAFVTTCQNSSQLISKMLPKGYALFLQFQNTYVHGLADLYEKAILEVLQKDFPNSMLARDLLPPAAQPA